MGLIRRIRSGFRNDWCGSCECAMDMVKKQLYAIPSMRVGIYARMEDAGYYKKALVRVDKKADIPTGVYACGVHHFRCPKCGRQAVKLTVFLPVRDKEMVEDVLYFKNGEMDGFL